MAVTPQTNVQLLICPLTADQENQITFNNVSNQNSYFEGLPRLPLNNCTYQRKDNAIRFEGNVDTLRQYNYVRYQNSNFSNKWFYAFIERMEYVNEYTTLIYIKTDVYQTWMFDITLETSFIERETVDDDGFYQHTIPEGLETGEYIVQQFTPLEWGDVDNSWICLQVSDFPSKSGVSDAPVRIYNGMPSGCYYIVFAKNQAANVNTWIKAYVEDQKADAILAIFPIPATLAIPDDPSQETQIGTLKNSLTSDTYVFKQTDKPVRMGGVNLIAPHQIGFEGYFPKNNKLYTNPYVYFYFNNFSGSTVEYNYEQFYGPLNFYYWGSITAGGEFKVVPASIYGAGEEGSYGYGVSMSSMPQGSWNSDTYQNWRALNMDAIQIEARTDAATSALSTGSRLWNLDILGGISNEISYAGRVASRMNQVKVASKMPNQARGDTATQSLNWGLNYADGGFYQMCIRREYAEMIDNYFTMFGYKVNTLKTPNINSRKYFNYIKTVGMNLTGRVPQEDLLEIKNIFDNGCTFWHDPAYYLNYNVDNSII